MVSVDFEIHELCFDARLGFEQQLFVKIIFKSIKLTYIISMQEDELLYKTLNIRTLCD